jgi:hypothetical protein
MWPAKSFLLNAALFDVVQVSVYLERRSAALDLVALAGARRFVAGDEFLVKDPVISVSDNNSASVAVRGA